MEAETIKDTPVRYSSRFEIAVGKQDMCDRAVQAIIITREMLCLRNDTGRDYFYAKEIHESDQYSLAKITLEEVEDLLFLMYKCGLVQPSYNKNDIDKKKIRYRFSPIYISLTDEDN